MKKKNAEQFLRHHHHHELRPFPRPMKGGDSCCALGASSGGLAEASAPGEQLHRRGVLVHFGLWVAALMNATGKPMGYAVILLTTPGCRAEVAVAFTAPGDTQALDPLPRIAEGSGLGRRY